MIVDTWEISGFGGGYENACQKMLWTGINYLSKIDNPEKLLQGTHGIQAKAAKDNFLGIEEGTQIQFYGICYTPESFKECESEMLKAVNNDCTGAMHQAVVGHLRFISKNGLQKWHDELKKARPSDKSMKFDTEQMTLVTDGLSKENES